MYTYLLLYEDVPQEHFLQYNLYFFSVFTTKKRKTLQISLFFLLHIRRFCPNFPIFFVHFDYLQLYSDKAMKSLKTAFGNPIPFARPCPSVLFQAGLAPCLKNPWTFQMN